MYKDRASILFNEQLPHFPLFLCVYRKGSSLGQSVTNATIIFGCTTYWSHWWAKTHTFEDLPVAEEQWLIMSSFKIVWYERCKDFTSLLLNTMHQHENCLAVLDVSSMRCYVTSNWSTDRKLDCTPVSLMLTISVNLESISTNAMLTIMLTLGWTVILANVHAALLNIWWSNGLLLW